MADSADKALHGRRVVITRAAEQSGPLSAALREAGAEPLLMPLVAFAPPENLAPLDEALRASNVQWIFFTSQNAVRAVQERAQHLGLSAESLWPGARIGAVGPATSEAAEAAGFHVTYVANKHQGTALANELGERLRGMTVLLPRSDRAGQDLVDVLDELGASPVEVVAYKTVAPSTSDAASPAAVLPDSPDAILFFSPSAVNQLAASLGAAAFEALSQRAALVAIGPVTQKALQSAGISRIVLARETSVEGVLAALSDFFAPSAQRMTAGVKPE